MSPDDPLWPTGDEMFDLVVKLGLGDLNRQNALTLYLFCPVVVVFPGGQRMTFRSSLDAVLGDVRATVGRDCRGRLVQPDLSRRWLGAIGYLTMIDQISKAVEIPAVVKAPTDFERLLIWDGDVLADEAAAIYALRCSFVHQYGLLNIGQARKPERRRELTHLFQLTATGQDLVRLGDRSNVPTEAGADLTGLPATEVDLLTLGSLAERLVGDLRRDNRRDSGMSLRSDIALDVFGRQSFFGHPDSIEPAGDAEASC